MVELSRVQKGRERQEREATRAAAKTGTARISALLSSSARGVSWKQTGAGVFSHAGLCPLPAELLALEAEQREL